MRRVLVIIASCSTTLIVAIALIWGTWGELALKKGRRLHLRDPSVNQLGFGAYPGRPLVVWLGDSTLKPVSDGSPSYAGLLQNRQKGRLKHQILFSPGLDPFHYYYLMGPATRRHPDVVVLIANLNLWSDEVVIEQHVPLLRYIPEEELLRATLLPLSHHGVRLPQLLLTRLLDIHYVKLGYYFADGLRILVEDAPLRERLGGPDPERPQPAVAAFEQGNRPLGVESLLAGYDRALRPSQPMVRMMCAAVDLGVRRGADVLVVVSPMAYHELPEDSWYDAEEYASRIEALRGVIEGAGGHLLNLQRALPSDAFRDLGGHFNAHGMQLMQELLEPALDRLLEQRASKARSSRSNPTPRSRDERSARGMGF